MANIFNAGDLPGLLSAGRALVAACALLSFEGANEPNNWLITYDDQTGGGAGTSAPVAKFQRDIYSSVKGDPTLNAYPVFYVSEGGYSPPGFQRREVRGGPSHKSLRAILLKMYLARLAHCGM
jgi:hypothetical protein